LQRTPTSVWTMHLGQTAASQRPQLTLVSSSCFWQRIPRTPWAIIPSELLDTHKMACVAARRVVVGRALPVLRWLTQDRSARADRPCTTTPLMRSCEAAKGDRLDVLIRPGEPHIPAHARALSHW
jgi:hypothetical protein